MPCRTPRLWPHRPHGWPGLGLAGQAHRGRVTLGAERVAFASPLAASATASAFCSVIRTICSLRTTSLCIRDRRLALEHLPLHLRLALRVVRALQLVGDLAIGLGLHQLRRRHDVADERVDALDVVGLDRLLDMSYASRWRSIRAEGTRAPSPPAPSCGSSCRPSAAAHGRPGSASSRPARSPAGRSSCRCG